jgi:hypothetical protein
MIFFHKPYYNPSYTNPNKKNPGDICPKTIQIIQLYNAKQSFKKKHRKKFRI